MVGRWFTARRVKLRRDIFCPQGVPGSGSVLLQPCTGCVKNVGVVESGLTHALAQLLNAVRLSDATKTIFDRKGSIELKSRIPPELADPQVTWHVERCI
jgi:hypothetical protein